MDDTALAAALRAQGAADSQLTRLHGLVQLAGQLPACLAIALVGSYAKGSGDRISDLDLVVFAAEGEAARVLAATDAVLGGPDVLNQFSGRHPAGGCFHKRVYLDFSSVECHVFETGSAFRLKRPFLPVWDVGAVLPGWVVDGEPIRHEDFAAYEYGDEGLVWELVDCIKWLTRGRAPLAKHHLAKLGAALQAADARAGQTR